MLLQEHKQLIEGGQSVYTIFYNSQIVWPSVPSSIDYSEPFYVENISDTNEILNIVKSNVSAPTITVYYSTDKNTWNTLGTTSTTALTYTLSPGDKLYLRANANSWGSSGSYRNSIKGASKVGGNIMSLLYGSNFTGNETTMPTNSEYNFRYLFRDNTTLQDASKLLLPATVLTNRCYAGIFLNCTSLVNGLITFPLPVSTAEGCYAEMFNGCTNVEVIPSLPLDVLPVRCYDRLFNNCSKVNMIICLATDISANLCINNWTNNVAASGTFYKKAGVTWPTGVSGIPTGWTVLEV